MVLEEDECKEGVAREKQDKKKQVNEWHRYLP
jgi:hypothetical protein